MPTGARGKAAFTGAAGSVVLVRNHEISGTGKPISTSAPSYDPVANGGTTTVQVTPQGEVLHSRVSLAGTLSNCSGGAMPWGSWLTCEETVNGPDVGPDFTRQPNTALQRPHGFVFEVPLDGTATAEPIRSAGRFAHESAVFAPEDGAIYLTEDNFGFASGFYRYLPPSDPRLAGRVEDGGQLQMLAVRGMPNADLAASQRQRVVYDVEWVDIDDPAPSFPYEPGKPATTTNDAALTYVGDQGREGRRAVLPARGRRRRPRHRLVHLHAGRRTGGNHAGTGP